jgi:hypothetical protein
MRAFARSTTQYRWVWQNPQFQFGFRPLIQDFWNERPDGVPHTWTTVDMSGDYGTFSEDTFPPALVNKSIKFFATFFGQRTKTIIVCNFFFSQVKR